MALTDEPFLLAQADQTGASDASIKEDIELLNALGEGETLDENGEGIEDLEKEAASLDQEAAG